jgi:hypothetical protein
MQPVDETLRERALTKLIEAIQHLSVEELSALETLLSSPSARKALWRMTRELLALRTEAVPLSLFPEEQPGPSGGRRREAPERAVRSVDPARPDLSGDDARRAFYDLLSDRERFGSTEDVVAELNRAFRLDLSYEKAVLQAPESTRRLLLGRFFSRFLDASSDAQEYRLLFRMLTGHEPNAKTIPR